jgi:hypothetical protein
MGAARAAGARILLLDATGIESRSRAMHDDGRRGVSASGLRHGYAVVALAFAPLPRLGQVETRVALSVARVRFRSCAAHQVATALVTSSHAEVGRSGTASLTT